MPVSVRWSLGERVSGEQYLGSHLQGAMAAKLLVLSLALGVAAAFVETSAARVSTRVRATLVSFPRGALLSPMREGYDRSHLDPSATVKILRTPSFTR